MRPLTALLLFLCAAVAAADDHVVEAGKIADLKYDVAKGDKSTLRVTPAPLDRVAIDAEPGRFVFVGKTGETYRVRGYVINFKTQKFIEVDDTVTFGGKAPPGPTPDVDPDPDVKPAPIPEPGFRVLFVFEGEDLTKYPRGQVNAMRAGAVADYLAAKCVKGPDGKTPETRAYDQHTPMDAAPKLWRDAMARPRASLPWVVVSNGVKGFEGPVPYNPADPADLAPILALLRKYGGN